MKKLNLTVCPSFPSRGRMLALSVAWLCLATTALAQPGGDGDDPRRQRSNGESLTEQYTAQASRLAKQMDLKKDVKEKFTVLYMDYMNARHNAVNPTGGDQESAENRVDFDNLTDEEATELIQKNFTRQEMQLQVDKEYLPKFLEFLTPAQAARIYLARGGRSANMDRRGMRGDFGGGPGGGPGGPGGGPGGF